MNVSATNSLSLRVFYTGNRTLIGKSSRKDATAGTLSFADSTALRTGIRRLQDFNFEDATEDEVQEKLQAFADTYNYTLESGSKYAINDSAVKNAVKNMKELAKEYEGDLESIGISIDKKNGQMSVSSSAAKNLNRSRFSDFFNSDSKYLKSLYSSAKHITKKVDIQL